MKHTPGPWIAPKGQVNLVCRKSEWESQQIGALREGMQIFTSLKNGEAQAEADANLIAAAPELLEALEMARTIVACYPKNASDLARIDSAIAKARGEK